jgi:hypothetical protein
MPVGKECRGWSSAVEVFNKRMHSVRQSCSEGALLLPFEFLGEYGGPVFERDRVLYGMMVVDDDDFAWLDMVLDEEPCLVVCLILNVQKVVHIQLVEICGKMLPRPRSTM